MRLDTPAVQCPACNGTGYDGVWLCDTCNGCGRLIFQGEPGFVTRIRDWWESLPIWKRMNIIGIVVFALGVFTALAIVGLVDRLWP